MALTKLKVALPLATAATATVVTAYLIISSTNDLEKNKEEDEALDNLELVTKPFEEEIIKAQEESDKKEKNDAEEQDLEKKTKAKSKDPEDKKAPEEEPKDVQQALLNAQKDLETLAKAKGTGEDQVNVRLPKVSKQGPNSKEVPPETKATSEEEASEPKVGGKPATESKDDSLDPSSSLSEEKDPLVSEAIPEPSEDTPKSPDDPEQEEDQVLERSQGLQDDPDLNDEQPQSNGAQNHEDLGSESGEEEDGDDVQEGELAEGQSSSGNSDESDNKEGGKRMTEEEIAELIALKDKMARFSNRLDTLLKRFR